MSNPVGHRVWATLRRARRPLTTLEVMRRCGLATYNLTSATLCGMARASYAVAHDDTGTRTWTAGIEPGRKPRRARSRPRKRIIVTTDTLTRALAGDLEAIEDLRRGLEREET